MNKTVVKLLVEAQQLVGREFFEWSLVYLLWRDKIITSMIYTDGSPVKVTTPDKEVWEAWRHLPGWKMDQIVFYVHNHPENGPVTPSPGDLRNALERLYYFWGSELYMGIVGESRSTLYMPRVIEAFQNVPEEIWGDNEKTLELAKEARPKVLDMIADPEEEEVELKQNEEWVKEANKPEEI